MPETEPETPADAETPRDAADPFAGWQRLPIGIGNSHCFYRQSKSGALGAIVIRIDASWGFILVRGGCQIIGGEIDWHATPAAAAARATAALREADASYLRAAQALVTPGMPEPSPCRADDRNPDGEGLRP